MDNNSCTTRERESVSDGRGVLFFVFFYSRIFLLLFVSEVDDVFLFSGRHNIIAEM